MTDMRTDLVPTAIESEEALLGSVMINPSCLMEIDITADEFYVARHRWIWKAFQELQREEKPIDFLTLNTHLEQKGKLKEVGGSAYLALLSNKTPSSLHASEYAEHVRSAAIRRDAIEIASRIAEAAFDESTDIISERAVYARKLTDVVSSNGAVHIGEWMSNTYDWLLERYANPVKNAGLSTGFPDVDRVFGDGLLPGVTLLGGAPGKGKSIFVQNCAENFVFDGKPGALYTPELRQLPFSLRVLSKNARVKVSKMWRGSLKDDDFPKIAEAIEKLNSTPFYVHDPKAYTTGTLRADLVRLKMKHGIEWAALDYLELLRDRFPTARDKWQRSEMLARELIYIANDLDLPILVVQKLNKIGWDGAPSMDAFSGGSDLMYDVVCATVLTGHITDIDQPEDKDIRTLTNVKPQRLVEGTLSGCNLRKDPDYPTFSSVAREDGSPMYPGR